MTTDQKGSENQGPRTGLTPHLTIRGGRAAEAIAFYTAAFGAGEQLRMPCGEADPRLMHAHLIVNGASLMLMDDFPEYHGGTPTAAPAAVIMHLQVDDADAWFARAVAAGAEVKMPLADMFWGDRYGHVADPFGHLWSIASPIIRT